VRSAVALVCLALAAARPAVAQGPCPDGTPPPCRAAPRRAAPLPAPGSRQRPFTIVAELDGTAPADVRAAARNLIVSALDESRVLAVLPDEQIRLGLTLAGRPETTRVDVATARELAVRGAVRTVSTGTIDQVGRTFHVAVRVVDADSNRTVAAGRDIARGEDDLIPTLDRVVRAVRASLGERRTAVRADRPLMEAITPSFAAYQRYQRARDLIQNLDNLGARTAYQEALALDSGFAAAWLGLRGAYSNLGFADSAHSALAQALARPDRLTEAQRLQAEAGRRCDANDVRACLAARERAYQLSGGEPPINLALGLSYNGRDSEAVAIHEEWARRAAFGLRPIARANLVLPLLRLGRIDEARRMAESLTGGWLTWGRLQLASWSADWPAVDSLAKSLLAQSRFRRDALLAQASVAAARGRVREALGTLDTLATERRGLRLQDIVLRVVSGSPVSGVEPAEDVPSLHPYLQLLVALQAAAAGDTGAARGILTRVRSLPPERRFQLDSLATLIEGWLAASAGRPAEVVRLLQPRAEEGTPDYEITLTQIMHWSLADAYERQNQLDSAAAVLERLAAWQGLHGVLGVLRGLTHSFAHQRLVMLYARMGRPADARRHWRVFSETFTTPDPALVHLVDEARAALASAERRP